MTNSIYPVAQPSSEQKGETGRPASYLPSVCIHSLDTYLESLKELSDPFSEPLHEKIMRSVKSIKTNVSVIKEVHNEKAASAAGNQNEVDRCCLTATCSLHLLIEHAQIWGSVENGNAQFTELRRQLIDAVTRLADHVIKIIQTIEASGSNVDDLFSAFSDDVRHVVRCTAIMAVASQNELLKDSDDSTVDDEDLNIAFIEGQDISLETSVRESMSAISEIREQLQTDSMESCITSVEREISDSVCTLIRTTGDFIHQGREVQMQLFSVSKQNPRIKSKRSRLLFVKNFVCGVNTLLQKARDLATNMRRACEHMDFENLVSLPDEISTASSSVVRQMRAFIQIQYSSYVDNNLNIVDELEYLEKKCNDIELAAGGLRKTVQRFLFLSPPKSLRKKHTCKVLNAGEKFSHGEYSSPLSERPENVTSPVCMRGRKHETRSARRLWSKESPV